MIYLDHAATGFPKPRAVTDAVTTCLLRYGGNPGRGAHALSLSAARVVYDCRERLAEFFGVSDPSRVIFTLNTTQALNVALKGLLRKGDHVLISNLEHNAVSRPLFRMEEEGRILVSSFNALRENSKEGGEALCAELARKMLPNTRMVVCTMASNLCSVRLPIRGIAALCRARGVLLVVDGAQGAGHEPISVDEWGIGALCVPGHKGLLGPQGCGALLLGKGVLPDTLCEGGNGVFSLERDMGDQLPERYEAGTLPTPAIAGLSAGIRILERIGLSYVDDYERFLYRRLRERLENTEGVTLYAPEWEGAILLFNLIGVSPDEVGARLNEAGICVRSGYHCSALGHKTLQTEEGGAVRVSFGVSNRPSDVDALWKSVCGILRDVKK